MANPTFIHLRLHSAYSLSEGALHLKKLVALAKQSNMPAVAVTDSNNLFGALEFSETATEKGIQPIIGLDLKLDITAPKDGDPKFQKESGLRRFSSVVLLAKDEAGYLNLMKLSSAAFLEVQDNAEPHVSLALLTALSAGLICLTGGPSGPINAALVNGQSGLATEILTKLYAIFGDRLYIELQRHGTSAEKTTEPRLIELAYEYAIPLVATNQCYFAKPDDYGAHDALICIAEGEVLSEPNRRRVTPEHYFKSQQEMAALFADIPEAIENTVEIAQRCSYWVKGRKPILPRFVDGDEGEVLRSAAKSGLEKRLAITGLALNFTRDEYNKRLDFELSVIVKMNYSGYFLIVADFIGWAKKESIPVGPGRGSGAGSLVAYALAITDLDPLRFGLLFERFLNPDRVSMPDFDIDFCQDRRDEVINYVQGHYGHDRVAQIITFGKLQSRMVTRDVGRVLQMPYPQVDRLSKLIAVNPTTPITLAQAIALEPRLTEERDRDPNVAALFDMALKLEGLYRNASTHAAGIVIADRPLTELVPLYREPGSVLPVTQFNMKYVEKAGLVKFDFLGLKTLTVIEKAQRLIRGKIPDFNAANIPLDDLKTFTMLAQGDTVGVFQLESAGMRDAVRAMKADKLEDLIALVALYRPGPMAQIPTYCARKLGKEKVEYLHPLLEPTLKETFGVITYQEQVQQVARDMAGYTLAQADLLRRAMGKKIKSEMDDQRENFMKGAAANGISEEIAKATFDACAKFAEYGFNKSHSAPYAFISYQTAWLKAHYPAEFLAASMTLDYRNTEKLMQFHREAQRMEIKILPPSVNAGGVDFDVKDGAIIYSMAALKNVGEIPIAEIIRTRNQGGAFKSLSDFAKRVAPQALNRRALESLVKAGAFDVLNANRAAVLEGVDSIIGIAGRTANEAALGQNDMFGSHSGGDTMDEIVLPRRDMWLAMEKLGNEFDAVGFYLSGHPLDEYAQALNRLGVESYASFRDKALTKGATAARLAGTVTMKQERRSKQGNKFAFVSFSDPSGQFEAVVFSDQLAQARELLEPGRAVVLRVEADIEAEEIKLRLQSVEALDVAAATITQGIQIFMRDAAAIPHIAKRLQTGGRSPARVTLMLEGGREVEIGLGSKFNITPQIKGAVRAMQGVVDVQDI